MKWKALIPVLVFVALPEFGLAQSAKPIARDNHLIPSSRLSKVFVDDDYDPSVQGFGRYRFDKIQDAIDKVDSGGTVVVYEGVYNEQISIPKPVNVTGMGYPTITDNETAVTITGDYATLSGFIIVPSGKSRQTVGIQLSGNNLNAINNQIVNCDIGIYATSVTGGVIFDNEITSTLDVGIKVEHSDSYIISNNKIEGNGFAGILMLDSSGNILTSTEDHPISNFNFGIALEESSFNTILGFVLENNTNTGLQIGQDSDANTACGNTLRDNVFYGIRILYDCDWSTISCSEISGSDYGIQVYSHSCLNKITSNELTNNTFGIWIWDESNSNGVHDNDISWCIESAITLYQSVTDTTIEANLIHDNYRGITIYSVGGACNGNTIFNNVIDGNDFNAIDLGNTNTWNETIAPGPNIIGGPFIGGNFWSDYNGWDIDGDEHGDQFLPHNASNGIAIGGDERPLVEDWSMDIESITGLSNCYGIEFDGVDYWVTCNDANFSNGYLMQINSSGQLVNTFVDPYAVGGNWGMRGLTFDGTHLYVGDDLTNVIHQIDRATGSPTGVSIATPITAQAIAYDAVLDVFWIGSMNEDIYAVDKNGVWVQYPNSLQVSVEGMAVVGDMLWIWADDGSGGCNAWEWDMHGTHDFTGNVVNGNQKFGGVAGGACAQDMGTFWRLIGMHQAAPDMAVGYDF